MQRLRERKGREWTRKGLREKQKGERGGKEGLWGKEEEKGRRVQGRVKGQGGRERKDKQPE